jgi:hypothetical protein
MHMKIARKFAQTVPLAAVALVVTAAMATQTVTPYTAATGGSSISAATVPAGTTFTFFGRYEVLTGSTANESGLGLKVKYDKTKFSNVVVDQVYTKCMIASPDKQETVPATSQVVFGWIDTSVRRTSSVPNGVVGWPGTADPAAPGATDGCLNPGGIVVDQAGVTPPLSLFRIQMTTLPGFTSGTTNVNLTSDGNYSYAGTTPGFTDKSIVLTGAAAPSISLTSVASRKTHTGVGDFDLPLPNFATPIAGAIDVEPRAIGSGHVVVFTFNSAPTNAGTVSILNGAGAAIGGASAVTAFSGNEMRVTLTGIPNATRVQLGVPNVNGVLSVAANIGFLQGDVNGNRTVQGSDVTFVQQRLGQPVTSANFRADVNANGNIQGSDVTAVQQRLGATLP